jgi:glutathionyl-hydroquinone reductase
MAELIDGNWSERPIPSLSEKGEFTRRESRFRGTVLPSEATPGRYHLYVSYACPWAHRTLIVRKLKKLDDIISFSVTNAYMGVKGWTFGSGHDLEYLANVYRGADEHYTGKITVPVLWDNRKETIVNNESSEIIRILNSSFNAYTDSEIDLYPEELRSEIDSINNLVYDNINNGVYKTGFASTQESYDKAFKNLFTTLDEIEVRLGKQPFLVGKKITEADIRIFTTLVRFDYVYYVHFKCNWRLIRDYPHLSNYLRCLYQIPEVKSTCHFDHIKEHYFKSHVWLNPKGIVPQGPEMDLEGPHNRGKSEFHLTPHTSSIQ